MTGVVPDDRLLCLECGEACSCDLYPPGTPHAHLAGGDDRYTLCAPCSIRFLERHRVPDVKGYVRWVDRCAEGCPYDEIRLTVPYGHGIALEAST